MAAGVVILVIVSELPANVAGDGLWQAALPWRTVIRSGWPPRVVALENVQNPENLGAVARTAEALGLDGLLLSGGCDVYHHRALRASMGALLRLPVTQTDDLPAALCQSRLPCYAAVPDAGAAPVTQCDFAHGGVIVIGNEGGGLSEEAVAACGHKITIPMRGRAESLNAAAAAAILCWEMVR
jgi:TrmH family RNA methyltransferase